MNDLHRFKRHIKYVIGEDLLFSNINRELLEEENRIVESNSKLLGSKVNIKEEVIYGGCTLKPICNNKIVLESVRLHVDLYKEADRYILKKDHYDDLRCRVVNFITNTLNSCEEYLDIYIIFKKVFSGNKELYWEELKQIDNSKLSPMAKKFMENPCNIKSLEEVNLLYAKNKLLE